MGKYDALISGSFAIQFFDHVSWTESDLDIFVEGEENSKAMGRYLMEQEKYNFVERTPDQPTGYADKAVIAVLLLLLRPSLPVANQIDRYLYPQRRRQRNEDTNRYHSFCTRARNSHRFLYYGSGKFYILEQSIFNVSTSYFPRTSSHNSSDGY
jgi:hypothetical protein